MNRFQEIRSLRLERLESRSLLAGDAFEFSANHQIANPEVNESPIADAQLVDHQHANGRPHHQGQRGDALRDIHRDGERLHRGQREGQKGGDRGRDAHPGHHSKRMRTEQPSQNPFLLDTFQSPPASTPISNSPARTTVLLDTGSNQPLTNSVRFVPSASTQERSFEPVLGDGAVAREIPTGEVLTGEELTRATAEVTKEGRSDESPVLTVQDVSESVSVERPDALPVAVGADMASEQASRQMMSGEDFAEQSALEETGHGALDGSLESVGGETDGFMEWAPLSRESGSSDGKRDTRESSAERSANQWHVGDESLSRLERLTQKRADVNVVDQMMREALDGDWFDPQAGMIALSQVQLPEFVFEVSPTVVEFGLESAVALHRSVDSVANHIAPALSGPALDAIMASLQQVATSDVQPVGRTSSLRFSAAMYPVAVMAAATVAASSRRKQKRSESNLQFIQK